MDFDSMAPRIARLEQQFAELDRTAMLSALDEHLKAFSEAFGKKLTDDYASLAADLEKKMGVRLSALEEMLQAAMATDGAQVAPDPAKPEEEGASEDKSGRKRRKQR